MMTLAMRIQIMTVTGDSFSEQDSRYYEAKNERNYLDRTEAFLLC
jgi:hypothetical protein